MQFERGLANVITWPVAVVAHSRREECGPLIGAPLAHVQRLRPLAGQRAVQAALRDAEAATDAFGRVSEIRASVL